MPPSRMSLPHMRSNAATPNSRLLLSIWVCRYIMLAFSFVLAAPRPALAISEPAELFPIAAIQPRPLSWMLSLVLWEFSYMTGMHQSRVRTQRIRGA